MKFFNDFDISESMFVEEPHKKLELVLDTYDFKDISSRHL
jgi:hypothetical protein